MNINNEELSLLAEQEEPRFLSILLRDKSKLENAIRCGFNAEKDGFFMHVKSRRLFYIMYSYYKQYGELLTKTAFDSFIHSLKSPNNQHLSVEDRNAYCIYRDTVQSMNIPSSDYNMLKDNINSRYIQKKGIIVLNKGLRELADCKSNQIDLIQKINKDLFNIKGISSNDFSRVFSATEAFNEAIKDIENRRNNPKTFSGIKTGIDAIDKHYMGFSRGEYIVIAGMVNGGKSTLMLNIAFNMAKAGNNVIYVTIEKPGIPIAQRLLCMHALLNSKQILKCGKDKDGINDYFFNKIKQARDDLVHNIMPSLFIYQELPQTPLTPILNRMDEIQRDKPADVIIVDYLAVIGKETKTPNRPDLDLAMVSSRLQAYGKKNNAITITGVQIKNSQAKSIKDKTLKVDSNDINSINVGFEDLGGSQAVIADADVGLSIVLNADYPATKAYLHSTKSRSSDSKWTEVVDFDGATGRITDPVFDSGQIEEVDNILYVKDSIDKLMDSNKINDLFFEIDLNTMNSSKNDKKVPHIDIDIKNNDEYDDFFDDV